MMLDIKVKGITASITVLDRLQQNIKTVPTKLTKDSALQLKRRIIANIPHNTSQAYPNHSTPRPLRSLLHARKVGSGHLVWFDQATSSKGQVFDQALILEKGHKSKNYPIPNAFGRGITVIHPGADPTFFFSRAVKTFLSQDFPSYVERASRELVR